MKVLFAAFGGFTNSSKALLDLIVCPPEDKLCLKNSFKTAPKQLRDRLSSNNYDLVLLFGQRKMLRDKSASKPSSTKAASPEVASAELAKARSRPSKLAAVRLETVGRNNRVAYHTDVNFPELAQRLARSGLDPIISRNAGHYLCNHIYFQAMKYADEKPLKAKVLFIHIPKLGQKPDLQKIAAALTANLDDKILLDPDPSFDPEFSPELGFD